MSKLDRNLYQKRLEQTVIVSNLCVFRHNYKIIQIINFQSKQMIKITYNRNNPLVHRFISHIDQNEANNMLSRLNNSKELRGTNSKQNKNDSRRKSDFHEKSLIPQEAKIISEFNSREGHQRQQSYEETRFGQLASKNKKTKQTDAQLSPRINNGEYENILKQFIVDESNSFTLLKEGYLRLWYEKMALQNSFNNLMSENHRKDEMINQLKQELQQKNGHPGPIFYNPQTPQHFGQSKVVNTQQIQQQNNQSMNSNSVSQQGAPGSVGHWASMHPNRNFNVVTRSNF